MEHLRRRLSILIVIVKAMLHFSSGGPKSAPIKLIICEHILVLKTYILVIMFPTVFVFCECPVISKYRVASFGCVLRLLLQHHTLISK